MQLEFAGPALRLSDADIAAAAADLRIEPAVIRAVDEVESLGAGFLDDGRPKILFERHVFSRMTAHRFDASHPAISNPSRGGYGAGGAHQYERLHEAIDLDRDSALQSASWGRYQCMGFNYEVCGFIGVEKFVAAMCASEAEHLKAFIAFCQGNDLVRFLVIRDWEKFTAGYNGSGNVDEYSARLSAAYRKHHVAAEPTPAGPAMPAADPIEHIRQAQRLLGFTGAAVDGDPGPLTRSAAQRWRVQHPGA